MKKIISIFLLSFFIVNNSFASSWETPVVKGDALSPSRWNDLIFNVKSIQTAVGTINSEITTVKNSVTGLSSDISAVESSIIGIEGDISTLTTNLANSTNGLVRLTTDQNIDGTKSFLQDLVLNKNLRITGDIIHDTAQRRGEISFQTKNNSNNGGVIFRTFVDADNSLVGNKMYSIWGYPLKDADGSKGGYQRFLSLSFDTYDGNTTFTKKIQLDSNNTEVTGNLGIKTQTPLESLHVNGGFRAGNIFHIGEGGDDTIGIGVAQNSTNNGVLKSNRVPFEIRSKSGAVVFNIADSNMTAGDAVPSLWNKNTLFFKAGGDIGIGTGTPTSKLTVNGVIHNQGADFKLGNNTYGRGDPGLGRALVHGTSNRLILNFGGDYSGGTQINSSLEVTGNTVLSGLSTNGITQNNGPNGLRINSQSGGMNFFIDTLNTTTDQKFTWTKDNSSFNSPQVRLMELNENGTLWIPGNIGVGIASPTQKLHVSGNVLASDYMYISDERLKINIEKINNDGTILEQISRLNGYNYNWNVELTKDKLGLDKSLDKDTGVLAQEVQSVFPQLVIKDESGYLTVKYGSFVGVLIEGINQLNKENKELNKKVEDLEERLNKIEYLLEKQ